MILAILFIRPNSQKTKYGWQSVVQAIMLRYLMYQLKPKFIPSTLAIIRLMKWISATTMLEY